MIEQLLEAKKISPQQFKIYKLFTSELGSECLKEMIEEAFWEEPADNSTGETFAFYDGRRSMLRAIKFTIEHVQTEINKQLTPEGTNG